MDKTNVGIKIPQMLLCEGENFIAIDERKLVERLIDLLQSRKTLVNVSFQTNGRANQKSVATIAKVEILLADADGNFNYYED